MHTYFFELNTLNQLSPTQLVQRLTHYHHDCCACLNPIWLNNQGQNVIGILPRFFMQIVPPSLARKTNQQNSSGIVSVLTTHSYRKYFPELKSLPELDYAELSELYQTTTESHQHIQQAIDLLMDYCDQQSSSVDTVAQHHHDKKTAKHSQSKQDVYHDGLMGFISYDVMASSLAEDGSFATEYFKQEQPTAYLGHYDVYLSFDYHHTDVQDANSSNSSNHIANHKDQEGQWYLHITNQECQNHLEAIKTWLNDIISMPNTINTQINQTAAPHSTKSNKKQCTVSYAPYKELDKALASLQFTPHWSKQDYQHAFARVQEHLLAGDCYQINLTQAWQTQLPKKTLLVDYLNKLHDTTNAPFAGYLHLGDRADKADNKFELLSCSPELFFTFKTSHTNLPLSLPSNSSPGLTHITTQHTSPNQSKIAKQHSIITKPIKGTRPRGKNSIEDQQLKEELMHSEKDIAENVMIVDLLRNDLGKYAKTGTVKVPKRFAIESYHNVHHMVSTITATLRDNVHPLEVLFASLPAGSITGTPKKRAVELIQQIEKKPRQDTENNVEKDETKKDDATTDICNRGAYCGSMGYMNFDGSGQWNVLIRTLQRYKNTVNVWAGGGVTVASDCDAEYQECWDKISNILQVMGGN